MNEVSAELKNLDSLLIFGPRLDGRFLFMPSRALHISAGAGFSLDFGSTSATLPASKIDYSLSRFAMEPNARVLYMLSPKFAVGAGLGYFFTLTGSGETTVTSEAATAKVKLDIKSNSGLRIRATGAMLLSGSNRPQILASYQLTTAGSSQMDKSENIADLSGHSFLLSYVYPIVSRKASQSENEEGDNSDSDMSQRRGRNPYNKSGRKNQRNPQQR